MDELDYGVIEALTLRPRAPWSQVGAALDVSAVTAARRWQSMRQRGLAWMSAYPGPHYAAGTRIIEVHVACTPHRRGEVASVLSEHPGLLSLSTMVGDWDLVVNSQVNTGAHGLEALLDDPVWSHPGIRGRSIGQAVQVYSQGGDWRIGALTPAQTTELLGAQHARNDATADPTRERIVRLLQEDPRISASSIAESLRIGVAAANRRLETLLYEGAIVIRTEVSAAVSGWSSGGYLHLDVPQQQLDAVGQFVARLPSTRLSLAVVHSRWNLSCVFWLNRLEQLPELEAAITDQFPSVRVAHRGTRLRERKRTGWILDEAERVDRRVALAL